MAGIWEAWKDSDGKVIETFALLTCEANQMMQADSSPDAGDYG